MRFPAVLVRLSLFVVLGAACGGAQKSSRPQAADFSLPGVDGSRVQLSHHLEDNKVVLLNFWATWCAPCASELPHLQDMYDSYKDQGFVVVGVSMDGPETRDEVQPFVDRYGLGYPVVIDEDSRVGDLYNPTRAAPFNVLIGRDGTVVWQKEGYHPGDEEELRAQVEKLLRN